MVRGRDFMRLPVITRDEREEDRPGRRLHHRPQRRPGARHPGGRERGLQQRAGGRLGRNFGLSIDVVIIDSQASVVKASEVPEIAEVLERDSVLVGNRVETTAGRELGKVENFYLDPFDRRYRRF